MAISGAVSGHTQRSGDKTGIPVGGKTIAAAAGLTAITHSPGYTPMELVPGATTESNRM